MCEWGPKVHKKRSCVEGSRGQRWAFTDASLTHPWKRVHDPSCTQTASQSGRDMERVSAHLPQSSADKTGNMRTELSRLAIREKHGQASKHLI